MILNLELYIVVPLKLVRFTGISTLGAVALWEFGL